MAGNLHLKANERDEEQKGRRGEGEGQGGEERGGEGTKRAGRDEDKAEPKRRKVAFWILENWRLRV